MSSRDAILATIRRSLNVRSDDRARRAAVEDRIKAHPRGVIPARGQLDPVARHRLFCAMVEAAAGTVETIPDARDVPAAVSTFLRAHNLPMSVRFGADPRLASIPWDRERALATSTGASDGTDLVGVSHAFGGVAESGTLMLVSGPDNPTTLNFLPDTHIVVIDANDIVGDYETLWERLRSRYGPGVLPRAVNLITGPSRSADIGQTLILGAHGPRRLHVMVIGRPA